MLLCVWMGCTVRPTDQDNDGWLSNADCDDEDPTVAPGRVEIPYDGKDNDCNRFTSDQDADLDGVEVPEDCDDFDPAIPGEEIPYDGIDNDCSALTRDDDVDGDGFPVAVDCDDMAAQAFPGGVEVPYDGFDNDCDAATPDEDLDGDGVESVEDCDDSDPEIGALDTWFEDCDGDGYAIEGAAVLTSCQTPADAVDCGTVGWTVLSPLGPTGLVDCNDADFRVHPEQMTYFSSPVPGSFGAAAYDFDCDGAATPQYDLYACFPDPSSSGCLVAEVGFDSLVPCGASGTFFDSCDFVSGQCRGVDGIELDKACL